MNIINDAIRKTLYAAVFGLPKEYRNGAIAILTMLTLGVMAWAHAGDNANVYSYALVVLGLLTGLFVLPENDNAE